MRHGFRSTMSAAAVLTFAAVLPVSAQTAADAFTIQGFLEVDGAPANGQYDIELDIYTAPGGAAGLLIADNFFGPVEVRDGVFSIEFLPEFQAGVLWPSLLNAPEAYLQFGVRPSGSGAAFTALPVRPKLTGVPRASFATDIPASLKPFTLNGTTVTTTASRVGIGTASPQFTLDVAGEGRVLQDFRGGRDVLASRDVQAEGVFRLLRAGSNTWTMNATTAGSMLFSGPGGDVMRLDVDGSEMKGSLRVNGELMVETAITINGADIAEPFDVTGDMRPQPGHVVVIDEASPGDLTVSTRAYDTRVAGVVSGAGGVRPGVHLRQPGTIADGEFPVAMNGRVYVYVDADAGGAVRPGDLLTTAPTAGHAMKASDRGAMHGAVIGKAMTSLDSGKGLVLVLVNLQ